MLCPGFPNFSFQRVFYDRIRVINIIVHSNKAVHLFFNGERYAQRVIALLFDIVNDAGYRSNDAPDLCIAFGG